ncbi:hypothetical protein C8R45DRAFT_324512 [Mycena sanguinolenta]|nr:hypothetical protein C8R45DRAFT_324512 [Mycena sanguinolenta]
MPDSTGEILILSTIHDLPLELLDRIIDCVAFQRVKKVRSNLASCSLVCRQWTHRSRVHFFKDCRLLLHYHNALAFGELLRSPYCTILPHVRQLTILNFGNVWHRIHVFDDIKEELRLLIRLESLKLSGSSWAMHGKAPARGFMSALASVVELEIDCPTLGDFDHALLVICAFPALERLYIHQLAISTVQPKSLFPPYPPYTPPPWIRPNESLLRPPPFSSLRVDTPAMVPLFHWLNWADSHRLTCLELFLPAESSLTPQSIGPLKRYLDLSDSLEHFKLLCPAQPPSCTGGDLNELFDLRTFKKLRTLHIELQHEATVPGPFERAVVPIVRTVRSPILERMTFVFDDHALFKQVPWALLDPFFHHFSDLENVCFSGPAMLDLESDIRGWFPDTDARGLVAIKPWTRAHPLSTKD